MEPAKLIRVPVIICGHCCKGLRVWPQKVKEKFLSHEPLVPQGHSLLQRPSRPGALTPPAVGASSKVILNAFCQGQVDWLNGLVCSSFVGNFRNTAVLFVLSWDHGSGCLQIRRPQVFLFETILCCHHDCSQDDNKVLKTLLTVCSLFHAFLFLLK